MAMTEGGLAVAVDVVSDVACPWCYVGQKRLEQAAALLPDVAVAVRWRPFQLDPTIPPGGIDRQEYMLVKFGNPARLAEIQQRLEAIGREEGISFRFEAMKMAANTLDAHRVIRWAGSAPEGVQSALVRRLFALNFEEGADLGDHSVLVGAAEAAGMDASVVATLLQTDADVDAVKGEIATATRMGIAGVPCYLLEQRYAVVGAQDAAVLADALRKVAEAKVAGELDSA